MDAVGKKKLVLGMMRVVFLSLLASLTGMGWSGEVHLDKIKLPEGFQISVFAEVPNARAMAWGDNGVLFVGSRREGKVYAVEDKDRNFKADKVHVIDEDLTMPSGLTFRNGSLYVGAVSRILRYDGIEGKLENPGEPIELVNDLPTKTHHGWKFIDFGPDGLLYVPVGAPCNICKSEDPVFATILRMKADGSGREIFAEGVRNTVGFDWHPKTGELWFTDNGRDMMGDDIPPDELNHAPKKGLHFGYPHFHANGIEDPEFGKGRSMSEFVAPAQDLGPHVAALGMRFYTGDMFPKTYKNQILIPEHGSWNRTEMIGYRITLVTLDGNKSTGYKVFAEGWLDQKPWGRPAAIIMAPDGSILVSDDFAGVIYRISYGS